MAKPTRLSSVCSLTLALGVTAVLAAPVSSTFDDSSHGWTVTGIGGSEGMTAFYDPSGYFGLNEVGAGPFAYFVAPSQFLGNQTTAYGNLLSFDLQQVYPAGATAANTGSGDVILYGASQTLAFNTANDPANGSWTSYAVPLQASAGWRLNNNSGAVVSESVLQSVLASLTGLWIRAEYRGGPETDKIDNVTMIPEPGTYAWFMGALVLAVVAVRRWRKA